MLQINPSEFLRIGRLISNSLSVIDENIKYLKNNDTNKTYSLELEELTSNLLLI